MTVRELLFRIAAVLFVGGISLFLFWWGYKLTEG